MPGPGLRAISAPDYGLNGVELKPLGWVQTESQRRAVEEATRVAQQGGGFTWVSGVMLTDTDSINACLRGSCGLTCTIDQLVAKATALGHGVPGYRPASGALPAMFSSGAAELVRAYCAEHAPEFISPTAEAHVDAATSWRWW